MRGDAEPDCPDCDVDTAYAVYGTGTPDSDVGAGALGYYAPAYLDRDAASSAAASRSRYAGA